MMYFLLAQLLRTDIFMDAAFSINPAVDIGQVRDTRPPQRDFRSIPFRILFPRVLQMAFIPGASVLQYVLYYTQKKNRLKIRRKFKKK